LVNPETGDVLPDERYGELGYSLTRVAIAGTALTDYRDLPPAPAPPPHDAALDKITAAASDKCWIIPRALTYFPSQSLKKQGVEMPRSIRLITQIEVYKRQPGRVSISV